MWGKYRRGKHLSIAVPTEIKDQLIRRKAWGRAELGNKLLRHYNLRAKCHHIPITFVPPHPDQSGVTWTENRVPLWRPS